MQKQPRVYMIGGPNGAGKTTTAMELLPGLLECAEYVNADTIAVGLSPFNPAKVSLSAGRLMLSRIQELAGRKADFAFETTMASRSFVPFLKNCVRKGYVVELLFVWLQSADLAVARVKHRVEAGGHDVPETAIRMRYARGISNFFSLYMPIAKNWTLYDNSDDRPALVARRIESNAEEIMNPAIWEQIRRSYA